MLGMFQGRQKYFPMFLRTPYSSYVILNILLFGFIVLVFFCFLLFLIKIMLLFVVGQFPILSFSFVDSRISCLVFDVVCILMICAVLCYWCVCGCFCCWCVWLGHSQHRRPSYIESRTNTDAVSQCFFRGARVSMFNMCVCLKGGQSHIDGSTPLFYGVFLLQMLFGLRLLCGAGVGDWSDWSRRRFRRRGRFQRHAVEGYPTEVK